MQKQPLAIVLVPVVHTRNHNVYNNTYNMLNLLMCPKVMHYGHFLTKYMSSPCGLGDFARDFARWWPACGKDNECCSVTGSSHSAYKVLGLQRLCQRLCQMATCLWQTTEVCQMDIECRSSHNAQMYAELNVLALLWAFDWYVTLNTSKQGDSLWPYRHLKGYFYQI